MILVDWDPVVVSTLRKALEHEPFEVRATADPLRALKWLEERETRLVLADPDMPAVQQSNLIHVVEERFPDATCALLSAQPPAAEAAALPRIAMKPWDSDRFRRSVLDLLHGRKTPAEQMPFVIIDSGPPEPPALAAGSKTILLLRSSSGESSAEIEEALGKAGFRMRVASTGAEALEILREAPLGCDLALVPSRPDGISGPDLIRKMLAISPGLTVIFQAEEWNRDEIRARYRAGAQNLIVEGTPPPRVAEILVHSSWLVGHRRATALCESERRRRQKADRWDRRAFRALRRFADAPPDRPKARIRQAVLVSVFGLLIGAGVGWVIEAVVSDSSTSTSPVDRVVGALERGLAKDSGQGSDFQRWYFLQRLQLERDFQAATRQSRDERFKSGRLDAIFRDIRAEERPGDPSLR